MCLWSFLQQPGRAFNRTNQDNGAQSSHSPQPLSNCSKHIQQTLDWDSHLQKMLLYYEDNSLLTVACCTYEEVWAAAKEGLQLLGGVGAGPEASTQQRLCRHSAAWRSVGVGIIMPVELLAAGIGGICACRLGQQQCITCLRGPGVRVSCTAHVRPAECQML
jgi:hypothetical protein